LNITNRCTSNCPYCIKHKWGWKYRGYDLKLDIEPGYREITDAIEKTLHVQPGITESVFCGYGEPLIRLDTVKQTAQYLKQKKLIVRVNTNGHANLIHKRDICPELEGSVDKICISLNGDTPAKYEENNKPAFGIETFYHVIEFIKQCKPYVPDITVTTVSMGNTDIDACKKIAGSIGVKFSVRPYLDNYETE
jgi:TatD DNase family protein